jgi:hypothetical protein
MEKNRKQGDAGLSLSSLEFLIGLNCFYLIYFKGGFRLGGRTENYKIVTSGGRILAWVRGERTN